MYPVPGLFEQRHIHERRGVALRAGVTVPVPSAAEVAALFDHAHVVHAGLDQARAGDEAREAAADEGERHVIALGLALYARRVRVVEVMRELALQAQVLRAAIRAQALVALLLVLGAQGLLIEDGFGIARQTHDAESSCRAALRHRVLRARRGSRRLALARAFACARARQNLVRAHFKMRS
jgi:hypothetical protein